jgi:hypothetical protein
MATIARIKEVTPSKKISKQDLQQISTPKQLKYLKEVFASQEY